jgi:hypothetical protein
MAASDCDYNDGMKRRSRIVAALLAAVALLFSQLAASGHGCPGVGDMNAAMQAMETDAAAPIDMALCERHCTEGAQASDVVKPSAVLPPATLPAPRLASPPAAPRIVARSPAPLFAGPAPPFLRSTVLRI